MTILDKIITNKKKEVALNKEKFSIAQLEQSFLFPRKTNSLSNVLRSSSTGIITEFKRRSPSKAAINPHANIQDVVSGYDEAGACGISVLTDSEYFGGSLQELLLARAPVSIPILRKDFIIDAYQLYEAKAYGADVILLIAAALSETELKDLSKTAQTLGLEVLLEVHNKEELEKSLLPTVNMIGVNNRNLKTFNTSIEISKELAEFIPSDFVKVSESGIRETADVKALKEFGYQGFLIGETFMSSQNPGKSASHFINSLQ